MALEALPVRLREIDVASGRAADYDRLLGGAVSRTAIVADVLRTQARQLKMPGLTRSFAASRR